ASAFVSDGSFAIAPGCTTNTFPNGGGILGGFGVLTATSSVLSSLPATVSATSGAGATLTQNVVVTPPTLQLQSLTLTPGAVIGGGSVTARVSLNRVVFASDASSTVSVRVSPGSLSNVQVATFAGCTGTPACSGSFTVPIGASSASVTITTSAAGATSAPFTITTPVVMGFAAQSDIIATFGGVGRSATLTVTASTAACTPTTCAAQGKNCGTILYGCGGSLVCGSCTAPQTCSGV